MKFDCGETWEERKARLSSWHPFFTILPRKVADHDCRCMEKIERKGEWFDCVYGAAWSWRYRAKP